MPGKGKPLNLDENPFEDPEWRLANKLLRDSGFSLPWIETRKEIETDLKDARTTLRVAWDVRQEFLAANRPNSQVEGAWQRAVEAFKAKITTLNKQIFTYNLDVPADRFQLLPVSVEREIEKARSSKPTFS